MVSHLGLRTHDLLYKKIGNIIAEILSAREKTECYQEVASHVFVLLLLIIIFGFFLSGDLPSNLRSFHRNFPTDQLCQSRICFLLGSVSGFG